MKTKNNKHTPGKWTSQYFTESTTLIKAENHSKAIAEIRGTNIKANAALIAAAPEMFEMLENILNETDDAVWISKIESILNKAKGE